MIQVFATTLQRVLLGSVPSLAQKEVEFAAAYPFGIIFRPFKEKGWPGDNEMADVFVLLNYGVGSADVGRFLPEPAELSALQETELFQAVKKEQGLAYLSLGQIKPILKEWIDLGDDIEVYGAASITGSEKSNHILSELRAREMKQWLEDELAANPDKIKVRWAGERVWPLRYDSDAVELFVQRRVELHRRRIEWTMSEFDSIIPLLTGSPEDTRIKLLIEHLQANHDDHCVILAPRPGLQYIWMLAREVPEEAWIYDIQQWDSQGPASPSGIVTKLRWVIERRLHPAMDNAEIIRRMRQIDQELMLVRKWTYFEYKKAKSAASLADPFGIFLDPPLGEMEKQLHEWFTTKEKNPNSLYHSIYVYP